MIDKLRDASPDFWARMGLWLVLIFAVLSSIEHVAAMFGNGSMAAGLLPALAVDGGLALSTYALGRFDNRWVKTGFWIFLILSIFANLDYSLQRLMGGLVTWEAIWMLDEWQLVKVAAQASPPLIGAMMMEINVAISKMALQPAPSTALATRQQPAAEPANPPSVDIAKPVRKVGNRTQKRIGKQPTMPRLTKSDVANEDVPELLFDNPLPPQELASWQVGNAPIQGDPLPPTELERNLIQAVIAYQQSSSFEKAAARLQSYGVKITGEGLRKQVHSAYNQDPAWVRAVLPTYTPPKK